MSRAFVVLGWLACCALSLQAQPWDALRGFGPGEKIKVVDTGHREYTGGFTSVSERGISVATGKGVVEIERGRVHRVQVRASSRRVRNILIGVGIGLAVGVAVDQSAGRYFRNETGENGAARAASYAAPIALFAGVGAAMSTYRTIYRAR
jgi:hypothetical protein